MKKYVNSIDFPECWEEVTPSEFAYLLKLRQQLIDRIGLTLYDIKCRWCSYVLSNRGIRSRGTQRYILCDSLARTLNWMWSVNEDGAVELTYNSTVNLLPKLGKFVGPASHGADLTFGQFKTGVAIISEYNRTHDAMLLDCLADVLYKPSPKRLAPHILFGIYAWFAYFAKYLVTGSFIINGHDVCFAPLFGSAKEDDDAPDNSIGMDSILFSVAESGVFGNTDNVNNTLLLQVMMKLLDDKNKADALERAYKK